MILTPYDQFPFDDIILKILMEIDGFKKSPKGLEDNHLNLIYLTMQFIVNLNFQ
jgi:hypothetical protein